MGLFDNIIDYDIECPYCKTRGTLGTNIEIQTKDLEPSMTNYSVHRLTGPKKECVSCILKSYQHTNCKNLRFVNAIAICRSPYCQYIGALHSIVNFGYISSKSRVWYIQYRVDSKGRITGNAIITQKDNITKSQIKKLELQFREKLNTDKKIRNEFNKTMKIVDNETLAVLMFYV